MKAALLKYASPFLFAVLATAGGTAIAATGSQTQGADTVAQAPDGPVDCKKTPEHPRCKNKK
jgi:hypothetical protein